MIKNKKIRPFMRFIIMWPLYLVILLVIMNIYVYFLDANAGKIVTVFVLVYIAAVAVIVLLKRGQINEQLVRFGASFGQVQKNLIKEMAVPYALLDCDGRLLSANNEFTELCKDKVRLKVGIGQIFPELTKNVLPADNEVSVVHVTLDEKKFRAELKNIYVDDADWNEEKKSIVESRDNVLISVFFYDETEILELQKFLKDRQLVVALLYIDNYEEALESIDEVRRSLLSALIDRKINKYFQDYQALLKKIEKDKYLIVFQNLFLEELKSGRFTILDEIRDVNIGNEMAVTISMGIGTGIDSYIDSYEAAHAAIDLALGRGGDQVVIKDKNEFLYYGGKSASVGKSTRVKARVKAQSFREIVEEKEKVIIMGHSMPDADAFGAAVGVYRIVRDLGKRAYIILNSVTDSISMIVDRFKSDQNSAEYNDMIVTSDQAMALYDDSTVLVVVDVNRASYTECPELLEMAKTKVLFDHHRQTSDSINDAVLSYIEPYVSSACEMVAEMLQYVGDGIKLKSVEAEAMYSGIMIDTNNFLTKTGVRTFEAAAFLKRCGADVTRIRKAFRTDMEEYIAKARAVATAEVFLEGFVLADCAAETVGSPTVLGAQVANELMGISGIKASFVFTEFNNQIYISARSIDEVNVQVVMEKLGGGGHMSVAGAQLSGCTREEAKKRVREVLKEMVENNEI